MTLSLHGLPQVIPGFKAQNLNCRNNQEVAEVKAFLRNSSEMENVAQEELDAIVASMLKKEQAGKGVISFCRLIRSGKICGFLFCGFDSVDKIAHLDHLVISEKYSYHEPTRQQVFLLLLQQVQYVCRQLSIKKICVSVGVKDKAIRSFYSKFGFYEAHVLVSRGLRLSRLEAITAITMQKKL